MNIILIFKFLKLINSYKMIKTTNVKAQFLGTAFDHEIKLMVPIESWLYNVILLVGRSPGLVVMGGDSCYRGHGFESCYRILVGHDIFHIDLLSKIY